MKPVLLALALLLPLAACQMTEYPPPAELPSDYTACDAPEDCVVVELGCCDACNGGEARSVSSAHLDAVRTQYTQGCALNQGCTEMGCSAWETTCEEGVCGLQRGEF